MINFGNFLHSDTAAIGLTSLGLARKIENKSPKKSPEPAHTNTAKQLQQNLNAFAQTQSQNLLHNNTHLQSHEETLNSLFGRNSVLNFNSGKLIG